MPDSRYDTFISYSTEDSDFVGDVVESLERRGVHCWFAPTEIVPGSAYPESIAEGIDAASTFTVFLSDASNRSVPVRNETEMAFSRNKKLFVVRLADVTPSKRLEFLLSSVQQFDVPSDCDAVEVEGLAAEITENAEVAAFSIGRARPLPHQRTSRKVLDQEKRNHVNARFWITLGVVCIVLTGLASGVYAVAFPRYPLRLGEIVVVFGLIAMSLYGATRLFSWLLGNRKRT